MEKRYPYKIPAPTLLSIFGVLGAIVSGGSLLFGWLRDLPITVGIALVAGISVAGCGLALTLIMRMLRPPYLILREDGIYLPGRPQEGWRVAFADIGEIRIDPPVLGYRQLVMKALPSVWSRGEEGRWWSVSERMLPTKDAFDEVCAYILAHVEHASPKKQPDRAMQ